MIPGRQNRPRFFKIPELVKNDLGFFKKLSFFKLFGSRVVAPDQLGEIHWVRFIADFWGKASYKEAFWLDAALKMQSRALWIWSG